MFLVTTKLDNKYIVHSDNIHHGNYLKDTYIIGNAHTLDVIDLWNQRFRDKNCLDFMQLIDFKIDILTRFDTKINILHENYFSYEYIDNSIYNNTFNNSNRYTHMYNVRTNELNDFNLPWEGPVSFVLYNYDNKDIYEEIVKIAEIDKDTYYNISIYNDITGYLVPSERDNHIESNDAGIFFDNNYRYLRLLKRDDFNKSDDEIFKEVLSKCVTNKYCYRKSVNYNNLYGISDEELPF